MELDVKSEGPSSNPPAKCATCEMLMHAPIACHDCHQVLEHVQGADYFELFGMTRSYEVNVDELGRRYLSISRNIHPDRFSMAGDEMQAFALRMSAAVNKAHEVLRDDFLRAEYLLESAGGPSASQDKSVPGALLTEIMTVREEIEEANARQDSKTLMRIQNEIRRKADAAAMKIGQLCSGLRTGDAASQRELRQQLNSLKYLNNLLSQCVEPGGGDSA